MLSLSDLEHMEQVLQLPLNPARRDYHWQNEAAFKNEFDLGVMAHNVTRLKELVRLAKLGLSMKKSPGVGFVKIELDFPTARVHNGQIIRKINHVDLQRQRAEERVASEGRPDESVSETLRELSLPPIYREAISRPERTWSGFARVDNLREETKVSRANGGQSGHAGRSQFS